MLLQVVLVRDMEAREQLPTELKTSNALIMTVGQSKGLEFDDVFLVDFCADSPAGAALVLQPLPLRAANCAISCPLFHCLQQTVLLAAPSSTACSKLCY
jgi:superfamily I DNA/RNA helicase